MYKKQQKGWLKHLDFIVLDLLILAGSYILAFFLRHGNISGLFSSTVYVNTGVVLLILDFLVMLIFDTMHNILRRNPTKEFFSTLKKGIILFGCISIYLFSVKDGDQLSRIVLWLTTGLHIVFCNLAFFEWKRVILSRHGRFDRRSLLLVADSDMVQEVLERFNTITTNPYKIIGIVLADGEGSGGTINGIPIVSTLSDAPKYICREWIDEVYICTATPPRELIECCNEMGVTIHRELHTIGGDEQFVEKIVGKQVLTSAMKAATPGQMLAKHILDFFGGLVGSFFAVIFIIVIGPMIKRASPGPIIFKQERIGQNGKHFKMMKIRSMVMNADEKKRELMEQNRVSDGMMFKLDFDPRIIGNEILPEGTHKTGIGEFIRRTSIDETPQFFNVLLGEMSLVGTRPPTPDEWERYEFHHRRRLSVKPGITGMWQVSGRSGITDFEEVVKLDTEYINNWSLGMDLRILLQTIKKVVKGDGAL